MLRVFLESPDRVFTRDQLMERVWDEPDAALDRTVDAHIKTLRRKLHEVDESYGPIETRRGIGYCFSPDR
jgi:two-component system catabolic regulation response regulator CreB